MALVSSPLWYSSIGDQKCAASLEVEEPKLSFSAKLPEKTVASVGQDVKVTCKLSAPTDKVQWLKSSRFLVDEKSNFTKYAVEKVYLIVY